MYIPNLLLSVTLFTSYAASGHTDMISNTLGLAAANV